MTGFGEAHSQQDGLIVAVEVRAINSRFFKLTVRATEGYASLEPHIEEITRQSIRRGTVQVNLRVDRLAVVPGFSHQQRRAERIPRSTSSPVSQVGRERHGVAGSLAAPARRGQRPVDDPFQSRGRLAGDLPRSCKRRCENLAQMRIREGQAMADDLSVNCRAIAAGVEEIQRRAPLVLDAYRTRLEERLEQGALANTR